MAGEPTTTPPMQDEFLWYREDRVLSAMQGALNKVVEERGNKAKAIAWDVRYAFRKLLSGDQHD